MPRPNQPSEPPSCPEGQSEFFFASHDALSDLLDLVERLVARALDEDMLTEDLLRFDVLPLVRLVERGDLVLGRLGDGRARLLDELVDLRALLKLLAERHLGDALRLERLLEVLLTADLRDDTRDLGVNVCR